MENRYVNIIYLAGLLLFSVIFAKTTDLVWATAELPAIDVVPNTIQLPIVIGVAIALVVTIVLYTNKAAHGYVSQVVGELEQVDWPTWKETQKSTAIVIAFAILLGAYLFAIDKIWSILTNYILVS